MDAEPTKAPTIRALRIEFDKVIVRPNVVQWEQKSPLANRVATGLIIPCFHECGSKRVNGRGPTISLGLKVAERNIHIAEAGIQDAAPIVGLAARAAAGFGSPLTFDAAGGVGQG